MEGDEDQLRQVFTNLIVNGLQAMPEGGELVVDAGPADTEGKVRVTVCDHGGEISVRSGAVLSVLLPMSQNMKDSVAHVTPVP